MKGFDINKLCALCRALLQARAAETSDMRTGWYLDAAKLIDVALTLHRHPDGRIGGIELFEHLMRLNAYRIQEAVREIDRRVAAQVPP